MSWKKFSVTALILLALISYPFVVHFSLFKSSVLPVLLTLLLLSFAIYIRFWLTAVLVGLILSVSLVLLNLEYLADLYFLPPIVINFVIGTLFLNSLQKNKIPLIQKYIVEIEGSVDYRQQQYARQLTWVWVFVLYGLMLESLLLYQFANEGLWSLFTNFINYFIILSVLFSEYIIRRCIFRDREHMSFLMFLNNIRRIKISTLVM